MGELIYNLIVARGPLPPVFAALFFGLLVHAQEPAAPPPSPAPNPQELPEEDESLQPKTYSLNPVESARDINVGNQYFKKGNYRAAANRFKEATLWDPGSAEAFAKLGEASERLHDYAAARDAYTKYFELAKDAKDAEAIKKRMAKWPKSYAEKQRK